MLYASLGVNRQQSKVSDESESSFISVPTGSFTLVCEVVMSAGLSVAQNTGRPTDAMLIAEPSVSPKTHIPEVSTGQVSVPSPTMA